MIQAYILFDALQSPNCAHILQMITQIRSHVDEETFTTQWRTFAGDRDLPPRATSLGRFFASLKSVLVGRQGKPTERQERGSKVLQALALHKLANRAYLQGEYRNALNYMIQAYLLYDESGVPSGAIAQRMIERIRVHLDEEAFMTQWRTFAGDRPFPLKAASQE
jgi:hypothetical protein